MLNKQICEYINFYLVVNLLGVLHIISTGIKLFDFYCIFFPYFSRLVDVGESLEPVSFRRLENMRAHSFAVSGTRKTATVVRELDQTGKI